MSESPASFAAIGGCVCGQVRYQLFAAPIFVHCCHCSWCQQETGSAFAVNAMIEATNVKIIAGEIDASMRPTASGVGQKMIQCRHCQTRLWSFHGAGAEQVAFVRTGTLDNPSLFPPAIHIYAANKVAWLSLSGDVPVMAESYSREKYWSAASIQRFNAAVEGQ